MKTIPDNSIDSCVCDPPYALVSIQKRFGKPGSAAAQDRDGLYKRASAGFMGQQWDTGEVVFDPAFWAEVLRVLKPGAHLLAFGGTRSYHRLACAIEDAGFEIRDQIGWCYASGFPKSQNVAKFIDKALGIEGSLGAPRTAMHAEMQQRGIARYGEKHEGWNRPWMDDPEAIARSNAVYIPGSDEARRFDGWGTALKPAWEPICMARKPLVGTVAANVLQHGTGALNIDACRVATEDNLDGGKTNAAYVGSKDGWRRPFQDDTNYMAERSEIEAAKVAKAQTLGRWPANLIHDGSDEVLAAFPEAPGMQATVKPDSGSGQKTNGVYGSFATNSDHQPRGDSGLAARFFYSAKADKDDRLGSKHPTVKPVDLMAYLCRLVTPPGGTVLDPFAGSGTTGMACMREGFSAILIEREAQFVADIKRRIAHVSGQDAPLFSAGAPVTPE